MREINIKLIESARLDKGIEKTDFCRSNGIGVKTYNRILEEPGARVKDTTILKISKALDLKASEVLIFS